MRWSREVRVGGESRSFPLLSLLPYRTSPLPYSLPSMVCMLTNVLHLISLQ